ncbi:tetratricopeptide repeat protein [Streptomyces sp. SM12]|uniref:ATP-binding protein n=2 Tax=Streptomyces sp. SM12 TaxID=1071602 RepID=UPI002156474F|nr:tetratricopeptide repeat protein [Streptomyces sp. SM12]
MSAEGHEEHEQAGRSTHDEDGAGQGPRGPGATDNLLAGSSRDTVQAGTVSGGVHFHRTEATAPRHPAGTPRQLPRDVRGFVNRTAEISHLNAILTDAVGDAVVVDVCVIAGTAGAGKTALALHWAHGAKPRFPDGQLYVNLRGYDPGEPVSAHEALGRFLTALGVPPGQVPADTDSAAALFRSVLADRSMLIVLDNAASVAHVRALLPGHPGCLVLVTSRSRLSGLAIRDGAHRLTLGALPEQEAVALIRAVTAGYRPEDDAAELRELAGLCARLPLALRIAAERAASNPYLELGELIEHLRDESALWSALSSGDEPESEAVRTVFAWSYRALPPDAARLFRLLGIHPGPEFGARAVSALAAVSLRRARQLLDVLAGAHLLEQTAPDRFEFHDLLRAYATDQARTHETPDGRTEALCRVTEWYLHTARNAQEWRAAPPDRLALTPPGPSVDPQTFTDHDQAVDWCESERANLPAAVRAAELAGLDRQAWQLAAALWTTQAPSAAVAEWLAVGEVALRAARRCGDRAGEARLLECRGFAHRRLNDAQASEDAHRAALAIRRDLGDRQGEATSLNALGLVAVFRRRLHAAEEFLARAAQARRELGDAHWEAVARANLAEALLEAGRIDEAAAPLDEALELHRQAGNQRSVGNVLRMRSALLLERGDTHAALEAAEEAVEIGLALRDHAPEGFWLLYLGDAQLALGQADQALTSYHRSATIHRRLGDRSREALAWQGAGRVHHHLGRHTEATGFLSRAAATHRELDDRWREAIALDHLAHTTASPDQNHPEDAQQHRREALRLIAPYNDPRANNLRQRLTTHLTTE